MTQRPIDDIPHWVWFTAMFLYRADNARSETPQISIGELYSSFLADQGLTSDSGFQLRNQGLTLMLAYGLLVIPMELWGRDDLSQFPFNTRKNFMFLIDTVKARDSPQQFIRCMRNAISHCNIEIKAFASVDQCDAFTFWNDRGQKIDFKIQVSWKGLSEYLDEVGKYYVNCVRPSSIGGD